MGKQFLSTENKGTYHEKNTADLKYTQSHEWLRQEPDGYITIGITEHAQSLLGDIVFVDHREIGEQVSAGDDVAIAESVKAVSEVYTPVSGEIAAYNRALDDAPENINVDAFGDGWLLRLNPADQDEIDQLMDADAYAAFIASEVIRTHHHSLFDLERIKTGCYF